MFVVKGNQPTLKEAIAAEFQAAFPPTNERLRQSRLDVAETRDKQHGRKEHRRLQASIRLAGYDGWPGLQQVCRLIPGAKHGRHHSKDYERRVDSSESMIKITAIRHVLRRLAPSRDPPKFAYHTVL